MKGGIKFNENDQPSIIMNADDSMLLSDSEIKLQQMMHIPFKNPDLDLSQ